MKPWEETNWEEWTHHPEVRDRVKTLRHLGWEDSQLVILLREIPVSYTHLTLPTN